MMGKFYFLLLFVCRRFRPPERGDLERTLTGYRVVSNKTFFLVVGVSVLSVELSVECISVL